MMHDSWINETETKCTMFFLSCEEYALQYIANKKFCPKGNLEKLRYVVSDNNMLVLMPNIPLLYLSIGSVIV